MRSALVSLMLVACGSPSSTDIDGGATAGSSDGGGDAVAASAPCTVTAQQITCSYQTLTLQVKSVARDVHYALPVGTAPADGWPTVIYYQGSFVSAEQGFAAQTGATFGAYNLSLTINDLLAAGFAVIAPEALGSGSTAWQTNIAPYNQLWSGSSDDVLVGQIFASIADGSFGPLDDQQLFAMGISSGGFMTSRMAVSYPGRFKRLAIHSGSYATCSTLCVLPGELPADHPPTLFLIGEQDTLVPLDTVTAYRDQLVAEGHTAEAVIDPDAGHEWLPAAPTAIRDWFLP